MFSIILNTATVDSITVCSGNYLTRMEGQEFYNVKLLFGKWDGLFFAVHTPPGIINEQFAGHLHAAMPRPALPPQMCLHTGSQFGKAERLRDVIIPARLQAGNFILLRNAGGQEKDRAVNMVPYASTELQPVRFRHIDVQKYQIRVMGKSPDSFLRIQCGIYNVPFCLKVQPDQTAYGFFIINQ
nr:hypothetical protein [uncultured Acetatifactor sp.]